MLATTERIELLDQAEELAKMIIKSEIVKHYVDCYHKLKNNKHAQEKIQAFISVKQNYEEVQRFGIYHPDYRSVMNQVRAIKRQMDLDEDVANFKRAENDLQMLLDEISGIIGHAVSEHIKVPTGNPFFEQLSACSGGCSSKNGCAC